jgi:subtilase family protein/Big-like domain-containing protein/purple acid phosphatase-like protein
MYRKTLFSAVVFLFSAASVQAGVKPLRFKNAPLELPRKSVDQISAELATAAARAPVSHVIVQFEAPIKPEERARLEAAGITLLDYLGDNGFFASVNQQRLNGAALAGVPTLTRVGGIERAHKLHPDLSRQEIHDWMIVNPKPGAPQDDSKSADAVVRDPIVGVYIKFHGDVPLETSAAGLVRQHGATIRSRLTTVNTMVIELPYSRISALADEDAVEWIEPPLPGLTAVNDSNRARVGADIVQAAPYNLNGAGVSVLVYDAGRARTTHQDFQGRAIVGTGELACTPTIDHATHVAGTIGGAGVANPNFKGMAPGVDIVSYGLNQGGGCGLSQGFLYTDPCDIQTDYSQAINTHGAVIANNSIGTNTAPNGFPCSWEGDYGVTDTVIDSIVRGGASQSGAPFRIIWANGNERQTSACNDPNPSVPTGYHKTAPPACAKNHITVGALNSNDDSMTSFSSWGPADDGRLKPDISGPGCQSDGDFGVTSCTAASDTSYGSFCGTSMASPTVCGMSALLMQDYRAQFPTRPDFRNSTLKILLAHTAVDLGNAGPDYQFGYGSVRIQSAVDFMRTGNFLENSVSQGGVYNVLVVVNPGDPALKVTLAWDDPPGTPNVDPALVNDLDLVVFDPGNTQRFPWTLAGLANPAAPAVQTQKNAIDNLEQVYVANPPAGVYRVEIRGFNVPQGPQPFSLCASPLLVNCSRAGSASLDKAKYSCSSTATMTVIDCDLNTNDSVVETVQVNIRSTTEPVGESVTLTETGPQTAAFRGTINLATVNSLGVLQVANGDTVTLTYIDANNGQGGTNVTVTATATVDCAPPVISNVQTSNIGARNATVTFSTDETARGTVRWGTSCGALTNSASEAAFVTSHSIVINGLSPNTTYFYAVDAADPAGNSSTNNNGGACFSFSTPNIPELFTQIFPGSIDPSNDLDNRSVLFTPDPGISHYRACTSNISSLPTDPVGGTPITVWTISSDDGYFALTLGGGATVRLHGVTYGSFFIGTNGYLTFTSGDSAFTESFAAHFSQPRVSALFNDLHPGTGGQVSYRQLVDRVAVTWLNVPHFGTANSNTCQIEMFFDGRIRLSYLNLDDNDGLAGLSPGGGLSPDFFESNLSAQTAGCSGPNPQPPVASNVSASTPKNTAVNIPLVGTDPNGDPLTYIITSLPNTHKLNDPNGGLITTVPYSLLAGGSVVRFTPKPGFTGSVAFQYKVNDGGVPPTGGDSNIATVSVTVTRR